MKSKLKDKKDKIILGEAPRKIIHEHVSLKLCLFDAWELEKASPSLSGIGPTPASIPDQPGQ